MIKIEIKISGKGLTCAGIKVAGEIWKNPAYAFL
jgi:hypothetical protein